MQAMFKNLYYQISSDWGSRKKGKERNGNTSCQRRQSNERIRGENERRNWRENGILGKIYTYILASIG